MFTLRKGGSTTGLKEQFKTADELDKTPVFRYENHTYQLLNLGLDIDAGGVTYHLSSEFAGEAEMGTVIDFIELERSKRNLV